MNNEKELKLVFVRHAQSFGNVKADNAPVFHRDDPPLTDVSLKQAIKLSNRFTKGDISKIFSSTLIRTAQTVYPTAKKLGLSIEMMPELMEVETEISGSSENTVKNLAPCAIMCTQVPTPAGGTLLLGAEQTEDLVSRAKLALNYICNKSKNGDTVLIASHGAFFGYLLREALGITLPESFCWKIDNCSVTQIVLCPDKKPLLLSANDTSHLL